MDSNTSLKCASCGKSAPESTPLKRCAKCQTTRYCSHGCQKDHWKEHKKIFKQGAAAGAGAGNTPRPPTTRPPGIRLDSSTSSSNNSNTSRGLSAPFKKPFHALNNKTYLHNRPEKDVFKILIDSYRMRTEDEYKFTGDVDKDSIYNEAPNGYAGFQRFLRAAEGRNVILPEWWSTEKAKQCLRVGQQRGWSDLCCAIEKGDVVEHYGNPLMPMQLRMLAEQILESSPFMQSSEAMLQMQMDVESGEPNAINIDNTRLFR